MLHAHFFAYGTEPHQPQTFPFPKREFGKKSIVKRSFQLTYVGLGYTIWKQQIVQFVSFVQKPLKEASVVKQC